MRGLWTAVLAGLVACGPEATEVVTPIPPEVGHVAPLAAGLERIRARGEIRFLVHGASDDEGDTELTESDDVALAYSVADALRVRARFVRIPDFDRISWALVDGEGDVVIERHAMAHMPESLVRFSQPVRRVSEVLARRDRGPRASGWRSLRRRTVHVAAGSRHRSTLVERIVSMEDPPAVVQVPGTVESLMNALAAGRIDFAVVDSDRLTEFRRYLPELRPAFEIASDRPVSWAFRSNDSELARAVDRILSKQGVLARPTELSTADLDGIRQRGELRVLTRNHEVSYFIHRGRRFGLDYELIREFAKSLGVRLVMVVPPRADQIVDWLEQGRGDVIAASFTQTAARAERVAFSRPYLKTREYVVGHPRRADLPRSPEELAGTRIHLPSCSSAFDTMVELGARYGPYQLVTREGDQETSLLLDRVADASIPITVADGHALRVKQTYEPDVKALFALPDPRTGKPAVKAISFAVRKDNPKLLSRIDRWLDSRRGRQMTRVLRARYLGDSRRRPAFDQARGSGQISPYDPLIIDAAQKHDLDWRLLAAIAYTESRFDPGARSWAGAVGMFQMLPDTARTLGYRNLRDPAESALAAAHYMRRLISRFDEPELPYRVRVQFALAAYNAGYGHVLDARKLAGRLGANPNLWFGHVEKAMERLAEPRHARRARYGYCRGREPVRYVRKVQTLYEAYTDLSQG